MVVWPSTGGITELIGWFVEFYMKTEKKFSFFSPVFYSL